MSGVTDGTEAPTIHLRPRGDQIRHVPNQTIPGPVGFLLTLASAALFLWTADRIFQAGYLAPLLGIVWDADADAANAGGQWLVQALLGIVHSIPRAGPELLVLMSILLMAIMVGGLGRWLHRRGWPALLAALVSLLIALHPATLYLASTGQPVVLALFAACLMLISVDRVAAIGDAQALMALGLCFALLFVTDPNALYLVLPALAVLPFVLKEMRDGGSIAALFLICLIPSIVVIATLLVGSMVVGVAPETTLRHWIAVLHGSLADDAIGSTWLARNGGTFFSPFTQLFVLCLACAPVMLMVIWRLLFTWLLQPSRPPVRFGTAILAFLLAPLAGAFAVLFWHPQTQWSAVATALSATATWTITVSLRRIERVVWVLLLILGLYLSWTMPWLWTDADKIAWRAALLGGI